MKRKVSKRKNEIWDVKFEELNRYLSGIWLLEAHKTIRNIRKNERYNTKINFVGMKEWKQYYRRLYIEDRIKCAKLTQTHVKQGNKLNVKPKTAEKFKEALKSMKNGKIVPESVPIELVKNGKERLIQLLKCLINGS